MASRYGFRLSKCLLVPRRGAQSLVEKAQQLFQDFADLAHSERGKMEAVMASERSEMKQLRRLWDL